MTLSSASETLTISLETFTEALARHARERPDAVALGDDRVTLNWAEVAAWVEAAAGWFVAQGLPRHAPVLGWLPNAAEWYLLRWACERAGLLWVPISSAQGMRELTSIVQRVRPQVFVTPVRFRGRDYREEARRVCQALGLSPLGVDVPETSLLHLEGPPCEATRALKLQEDAHVLATTGSEGPPKLALYTMAAAVRRAVEQATLLRMTPEDVVLALSAGTGPGKTSWLAAPMVGAAVFALPIFHPQRALELIERRRATIVCGTPTQLLQLLPEMSAFDITCVRLWYTAGAVLPSALAEELEARSSGIVISVYGATDFGGWAAPDLDDPPAVRHRTVGRPRGGTEFRIVDREGREVAPGEIGEIIGRGPCSVIGYYGGREVTEQRWRDGWFFTGDVGRFDEKGNLVILGRLRELIIRGGENIAPEEIEQLLRTHPAVSQVAIIGVPDPVFGERVCACIVPAHDPPPTLEDVRAYLRREGLAPYKLPEQLVILPALPVAGDKVNRAALAAEIAGRRDRDERADAVSVRRLTIGVSHKEEDL